MDIRIDYTGRSAPRFSTIEGHIRENSADYEMVRVGRRNCHRECIAPLRAQPVSNVASHRLLAPGKPCRTQGAGKNIIAEINCAFVIQNNSGWTDRDPNRRCRTMEVDLPEIRRAAQ